MQDDRQSTHRRLISRKEARRISGLSERSQTRTPDFPKAVEISAGRVALVEGEVMAWVAAKIAARDRRTARLNGPVEAETVTRRAARA